MSEGLNKVLLLGSLGADPELRFTQGGSAVLSIRMATTERYKDRDDNWKERTDWHSVVVFGKRAEALGKILQKGSTILAEGSLRTSSYDDKDGIKRWKTEVVASNIILAGGRPRSDGAAQDGGPPRGGQRQGHGAPRGNGGSAGRGAPAGGYDEHAESFGSGPDSDVPF